jgi:hypothetical protein
MFSTRNSKPPSFPPETWFLIPRFWPDKNIRKKKQKGLPTGLIPTPTPGSLGRFIGKALGQVKTCSLKVSHHTIRGCNFFARKKKSCPAKMHNNSSRSLNTKRGGVVSLQNLYYEKLYYPKDHNAYRRNARYANWAIPIKERPLSPPHFFS